MKYKGKVVEVGGVRNFGSNGFRKRTVVVSHNLDAKYPSYNPFDFKNDDVTLLDNIKKGMEVEVTFDLDGRRWENKQKGRVDYFAGLTAHEIEVTSLEEPEGIVLNEDNEPTGDDDDIPF